MTSFPFLAVWLATAAQLPIATQATLPTGETAELAAEQLVYEPSKQLLTLKGNTLLKTEQLTLRADELIYDQQAQRATARGKVMLVAQGTIVAVADEISVDIKTLEATVKGGLFMQKRNVDVATLLAAKTPEELKALGENLITLSGERIRKTGEKQFTVDGISFTPCDCKPGEPTWRVEAAGATVEVGEKAILTWPKVYVYDVPVFALPWAYLPLAERRTGLLLPKPQRSALNGFAIEQPLFVTLGESYDLTLTPGYFFGAPAANNNLPSFGIEGPRLHTEFRYHPTEALRGRLALAGIYDLRPQRDVIRPWLMLGELNKEQAGGEARGLRGEASFQHTWDMGNGWNNRADLSLVSDGNYTRDVQADVLLKEVQYLRSSAVLFHRADDHYAGLDLTLRQDLRWGFSLFQKDYLLKDELHPEDPARTIRVREEQPFLGPNTFQRLPALTYGIPERPLWGPFFGGVKTELVRIAPLLRSFGDEGSDGIYDLRQGFPELLASGQGNGQFNPGERESRLRLDLQPRLSAQVMVGEVLRARPYAWYRQDVYLRERRGNFSQRGYPLVGLELDTELARTFGPTTSLLRHSINPSVDLRWVPLILGETPGDYDEVDTAVTTHRGGVQAGFAQGVVEVHQQLATRNASGAVRELLRLDLGQPFDLGYRSRARLGDSFARARLALDRVSLESVARYNLQEERLTQFSGTAGINDGKGNHGYLRYDNLAVDGSDQLRRGIDTLMGPSSLLSSAGKQNDTATRAQLLVAGGRYNFPFGLGLRYEAVVTPNFQQAVLTGPGKGATKQPIGGLFVGSPLAQQVVGVSYGPACDCWRLEGFAVIRRNVAVPDFGVNLTLSRFGTFGSGG